MKCLINLIAYSYAQCSTISEFQRGRSNVSMTKIYNYGQGEENKIIEVISYDMMGNQHGLSFKKSKTMSRKKMIVLRWYLAFLRFQFN